MKTEPRRSIGAKRHPESQNAILEAALGLLVEKGLGGFSIEEVARRASASKPTIYRWWPNKVRLLLDVYARLKVDLLDPDTGSLAGDVAGFWENLFEFWRTSAAGKVFQAILAESQNDSFAHVAFAEDHARRIAGRSALFSREHAGKKLTEAQATDLAELAVSYAVTQLLLGKLESDKSELERLATRLVKGFVSD